MDVAAFADESEGQSGERLLVLAGHVYSKDSQARFAEEWNAVLNQRPALSALHMVDAWALAGGFSGWTAEMRDHKVSALASVINRWAACSLTVLVSQHEWDEIVRPRAPHELRHSYFAAYYAWIVGVARLVRQLRSDGSIAFFFDEKGAIGADTAIWHGEVMKSQPKELRDLIASAHFLNDKDCPQLQAADLLAWHVRRAREGRLEPAGIEVMNSALGSRYAEIRVDRSQLENWGAAFSEVPGIAFVRDKGGATRRRRGLRERLAKGLGPPLSIEQLRNPFVYYSLLFRIQLRATARKFFWKTIGRGLKRSK